MREASSVGELARIAQMQRSRRQKIAVDREDHVRRRQVVLAHRRRHAPFARERGIHIDVRVGTPGEYAAQKLFIER